MNLTPEDLLRRIAEALERIAPLPVSPPDWASAPAWIWDGHTAHPLSAIDAPPLDLLQGIDAQKARVVGNVRRLASRKPAHDMLLWGARGMGKSALTRAAVAAMQAEGNAITLVQASAGNLAGFAALMRLLASAPCPVLLFIDDLGFEGDAADEARQLRSLLEGGVMARPTHVRLAVTSNRRAIVDRRMSEQDDLINPRDAVDDRLALSDRFGLSLGFHACSQDDYLAIIACYAQAYDLAFDEAEALEWAKRRGARSGRTAWQFVTELLGRRG